MIPVLWVGGRRLCWDQHTLSAVLSGPQFRHDDVRDYPGPVSPILGASTGAVLIVPARFHTPAQVNDWISDLEWAVVVLTSDEESTFDHEAIVHPNCRVWVMTPQPGVHLPGGRYLGEGAPGDEDVLAMIGEIPRAIDVAFAGQVTHERRHAAMAAMEALHEGITVALHPTSGFAQGVARDVYLGVMAQARVAPCPSGPATPDSFRVYEALEAGAMPIADGLCPRYPDGGYWTLVYPAGVPFPVVHDWNDLGKEVDAVLAGWPGNATRAQAWWLAQKRKIRTDLEDQVAEVCNGEVGYLGESRPEQITAVVTTSPTSGGPDRAMAGITAVVESIRERLPEAEIIVVADGVRAEQEHLRGEYEAYMQRLVWACAHTWDGVLPIIVDHHAHQANCTRLALEHVRTPLLLFVEHDMPLVGSIPFGDLSAMVRSGYANLVRLGQDRELEHYGHLMLDQLGHEWTDTDDGRRVPMVRTVQWSQRPHLASTGFYRQMLGSYFGTTSRTMIEDVMHGVVQVAWHRYGDAGWEQFRLVFYAPPGDQARSRHVDGRGDDPKFDMEYAYDGPVPEGAPAPTVSDMERLRRGESL